MKKALTLTAVIEVLGALAACLLWGGGWMVLLFPAIALLAVSPLLALRTILDNQDILMEQL